jgi:antitoxin component YwqK of YwqJK toxin-antitoxin module
MNKKFGFVFLAVVALALVLFALSGKNTAGDISKDFPVPTGTRVELPPQAGEEIRYVYFADDKVTKKMTQIEYRSGVTSFTTYRSDGTKNETRAFFPLKDGASKRMLRSLVTYDDNGSSYKSHQVYREDGSLERNGGRLPNGGYQTLYFNATDGRVQRQLVFNDNSALESEESFSDDGKLIEKTEKVSEYGLKTTRWSPDGKMLSEITDNTDGTREGKLFYEDGETVKVEFNYRPWAIEVNYFDPKGVHTLEVSYQTEGVTITHFAPDTKPLFKQYFVMTGGKTLCDVTLRLVKVEEFKGTSTYDLKRLIGIADDGKTPNRVITPVNNSWSYDRDDADLHPDGSVKSVKHYDSSNQVSSTKTFAPGVQKLTLAPEMFVKPTFECLDPPESKIKTPPEAVEEGDVD